MANLEINFAGLKMRSPIGIAPLNPAIAYGRNPKVQADWLMKHIEAGAGYVFVSATRPERSSPLESKPAIKFLKVECPGFAKREGILSTGDIMAIQFYLDKSLEVMSRLKQQLPKDVPIIAQPHVAGPDLKKWVALCKLLEEAGADALELNFCPISIVGDEETDDEATKLINAVDTLEMRTLRKLGLAPRYRRDPGGPVRGGKGLCRGRRYSRRAQTRCRSRLSQMRGAGKTGSRRRCCLYR